MRTCKLNLEFGSHHAVHSHIKYVIELFEKAPDDYLVFLLTKAINIG